MKKLLSSGALAAAMLMPSAAVHAAVTGSVVGPDGNGVYTLTFHSTALYGFGWPAFGDDTAEPTAQCLANCSAAYTYGGVYTTSTTYVQRNDDFSAVVYAKKTASGGARIQFNYTEQVAYTDNPSDFVAGTYDPALLDVKIRYGQRTLEASGGILPGETRLTITNGDLLGGTGLRKIGVWINGKPVFKVAQGADAAHRLMLTGATQPLVFDIAPFISATGESTVVVEGIGQKGSTANVVVGPPDFNVVLPH